MEPKATGETPSALLPARLPDSPQPWRPHCPRGPQPAAKKGGCQGAPSLKERKGKKKCLLIVVCGIGEIPQSELPVKFYQRVYKADSQERSSLGEVTLSPLSSCHLIALTLLPLCRAYLIFLTGFGAAGESAGPYMSCGTNPGTQPKAIKLEVV